MSVNHPAVSPVATAPLVLREVLERLLAGESLAEAEAQQLLARRVGESNSSRWFQRSALVRRVYTFVHTC